MSQKQLRANEVKASRMKCAKLELSGSSHLRKAEQILVELQVVRVSIEQTERKAEHSTEPTALGREISFI